MIAAAIYRCLFFLIPGITAYPVLNAYCRASVISFWVVMNTDLQVVIIAVKLVKPRNAFVYYVDNPVRFHFLNI